MSFSPQNSTTKFSRIFSQSSVVARSQASLAVFHNCLITCSGDGVVVVVVVTVVVGGAVVVASTSSSGTDINGSLNSVWSSGAKGGRIGVPSPSIGLIGLLPVPVSKALNLSRVSRISCKVQKFPPPKFLTLPEMIGICNKIGHRQGLLRLDLKCRRRWEHWKISTVKTQPGP